MKSVVRIGGAGAFFGDSNDGPKQLLRTAELDYLIFDYLAELTMSILAKARDRDPSAGYATDFVRNAMPPIIAEIARRGIRVVTNAGGMNPKGCAEALRELARKAGVSLRIGVVEGDDLLASADELKSAGARSFADQGAAPEKFTSMNAYLGATPIARALALGADIVVTGRCVDSALALGPLIHEFGWSPEDYDKMAAGSLLGHIIECGTQGTGGLFTDWRDVPGREDIGYPIAECRPDGGFDVYKGAGTGGLVTPLSVTEQMLYEVGDPASYLLPDVTCDLTNVTVRSCGDNRVRIEGVKGRAPTDSYKVSASYLDGYRSIATLTVMGSDAVEKARHMGAALIARTKRLLGEAGFPDYEDVNLEVLGSEEPSFGVAKPSREVVLRIAVRHKDEKALRIFGNEIAPFGTAGVPGTTGFGARPKPQAVYRLFSMLVPKSQVPVRIEVDGQQETLLLKRATQEDATKGDVSRAAASPAQTGAAGNQSGKQLKLRAIAVGRSGDKGDMSNIGVIARHPELYPLLLDCLTTEVVANHFRHLCRGKVTRYEVPGVHALNFTLESALAGGGTASLRSDALGKAFAQILLELDVQVPDHLLPHARLD